MNAYSEMRINKDISSASIDAKEQEAMCLWEAPEKGSSGEGSATKPPAINNTSALIRWVLLLVMDAKQEKSISERRQIVWQTIGGLVHTVRFWWLKTEIDCYFSYRVSCTVHCAGPSVTVSELPYGLWHGSGVTNDYY